MNLRGRTGRPACPAFGVRRCWTGGTPCPTTFMGSMRENLFWKNLCPSRAKREREESLHRDYNRSGHAAVTAIAGARPVSMPDHETTPTTTTADLGMRPHNAQRLLRLP